MNLLEKLKEKKTTVVMILGVVGLLLIMISSVFADKEQSDPLPSEKSVSETADYNNYRLEMEKRLEEFLGKIEGAGDVEVFLTVGSSERYVYAEEEKKVKSDNKTEEENKYVIYGSGKEPLVETVKTPQITGAVIICTGGDSPAVEERIYKAVSSALGISTGKIYVTKMK